MRSSLLSSAQSADIQGHSVLLPATVPPDFTTAQCSGKSHTVSQSVLYLRHLRYSVDISAHSLRPPKMTDAVSGTKKLFFISGHDSNRSPSTFWNAVQKTPADHLCLTEQQLLSQAGLHQASSSLTTLLLLLFYCEIHLINQIAGLKQSFTFCQSVTNCTKYTFKKLFSSAESALFTSSGILQSHKLCLGFARVHNR